MYEVHHQWASQDCHVRRSRKAAPEKRRAMNVGMVRGRGDVGWLYPILLSLMCSPPSSLLLATTSYLNNRG
eukprot:3199732-Pyramimonas_sp.AAC.2